MFSLELIAALPLAVLALGAVALLMLGLFRPEEQRWIFRLFGGAICVAAWLATFAQWFLADRAFSGAVFLDPFTVVVATLILGATFCALLLQSDYFSEQGMRFPRDIEALMLLAAAGALVMVQAANLLVLFLGFELLSLSVYALAAAARREAASAEAGLKYFLLGAFSSSFLLYGLALLYAASGSLTMADLRGGDSPLFLLGLGLVIFGFAFKLSLVPFHFWTPDVYHGAPVSIVAFMAVVVKTAAFASFLRLVTLAGVEGASFGALISLLAVLTMTVGNLAALMQTSVKRLLAYSSIAHAGYIALGLLAGETGGFEAVLYYLFAYALMTIASFGVVLVATSGSERQYALDDLRSLAGLGWREPWLGLCVTIAVLSLAGLPPLAGFFGKFYVFTAVLRSEHVFVVVAAALNSVVALAYYLRILVVMYLSESHEPRTETSRSARCVLGVVTAGTILFGIYAESVLGYSQTAVRSLKPPQVAILDRLQ